MRMAPVGSRVWIFGPQLAWAELRVAGRGVSLGVGFDGPLPLPLCLILVDQDVNFIC